MKLTLKSGLNRLFGTNNNLLIAEPKLNTVRKLEYDTSFVFTSITRIKS